MRQMMNATSQMPDYIYMPLPSGEADVFIYKLVEEVEDGYLYETNEFRTARLTEEDVVKDPVKYLDYKEIAPTLEEKVTVLESQNEILEAKNEFLEECLIELANIIYA